MNIEKYIKQLNFNNLTPIQSETIKHFNSNKNLVGVAPTGTGKTHAYLIPLIASINTNIDSLQAIIVLPTNELVNQVRLMLEPLLTDDIKVKTYDSKINKIREYEWLSKYQPHIVIATPERIYDFSQNGLKIDVAKYIILDEADMMFDEDFLKQIDAFVVRTKQAKYFLFSASITENMYTFIKKYFGVYDLIDTTNQHELKIEQRLIKTNFNNRLEILEQILNTITPFFCLIFVTKKEDQQEVFDLLLSKNLNVGLLSGNLNQHQRKNVIANIRDFKYQYVVASDLAARGLDFEVSHVINYDLPYHLEYFKHRSGRTGRMEKDGIVITIATNDCRHKITRLEKMGYKFKEYKIINNEMVLVQEKKVTISTEELQAIKKIPKPKKVKPNYRKKNKEKILKAKKEVRRKKYAKNR